MIGSIKIFNPKEKPFGELSNNFMYSMRLDGNIWKSVTNYVYGMALKESTFRISIKNTKPQDVEKSFLEIQKTIMEYTTSRALREGLEEKFKDPVLLNILLSTKNAPIIYKSPNSILGIGLDGHGKNLLGKFLMQIRYGKRILMKQENIKQIKEDENKFIYESYLALSILNKEIGLYNNLTEYLDKNPSEIISHYESKGYKLGKPSQPVIIKMYENGQLDPVIKYAKEYPELLIPSVWKKQLRKLANRLETKRKSIILDMYIEYIIEKIFENDSNHEFTKEDYEKAKKKQIDTLKIQDRIDLQNRVYKLYLGGMCSERLSENIDGVLDNLRIPSEEEIVEAELFNIDNITQSIKEDKIFYNVVEGKPIYIYPFPNPEMKPEYNALSPIAFTGKNFSINHYEFPTVTHYITYKLFQDIVGFTDSYKALLVNPNEHPKSIESFLTPPELANKYEKIKKEYLALSLRKNAKIALEKKFEDRKLQNVLLMTGKINLIWDDKNDKILGPPENFVGKELMRIRENVSKNREGETLKELTEDDIIPIFTTNKWMYDWLIMRVRDLCKAINIIKLYIFEKYKIKQELSAEFIIKVLDNIYQPCSNIHAMTNEVSVSAPKFFRDILIKECHGFKKVTKDIGDAIWKRIVVMLYYLITAMKIKNTNDIQKIITNYMALLMVYDGKCTQVIQEEDDNCIVSAIINILRGIHQFNKQNSYNSKITEIDVKTAASIIIHQDLSEEIEKKEIDLPEDESVTEEHLEFLPEEDDDQQQRDDDDVPDFEDYYEEEDPYDDEREDYATAIDALNIYENLKSEFDNDIEDPEISNIILGAVEAIKISSVSSEIKRNRINFFATLI